jgi:membrane-associated protein
MSTILPTLLTLVLSFGYPLIALIIFIGYLGLPIPATTLLLALGSFSASGNLNISILIPLIAVTALCGDILGYYIGKRFDHLIDHKTIHWIGLTPRRMYSVNLFLKNWGGWCVFLTHSLLTPIEVPVNLLCGISKYSFKRFVLFAAIGEILWTSFYLYLGYLFGINWELLASLVTKAPQILTLIILGVGFVIISGNILVKHITRHYISS